MNEQKELIKKCKQHQKGFTLIELIVVIAIIGILAAILLPRYFGFTDQARQSAALSDAQNIKTLAETYYAQYGVMPTITETASTTASTKTAGSSGFAMGTATCQLTAPAGAGYGTIDSPVFQGYLGAYVDGGGVSSGAITAQTALSSYTINGFTYISNTGHVITCDANGTITAVN